MIKNKYFKNLEIQLALTFVFFKTIEYMEYLCMTRKKGYVRCKCVRMWTPSIGSSKVNLNG